MVGAIGLSTPILLERLADRPRRRLPHVPGLAARRGARSTTTSCFDSSMTSAARSRTVSSSTTTWAGPSASSDSRRLPADLFRASPTSSRPRPPAASCPMAAGARHEQAGELQHFMDVNNFPYGALYGECSLLASYAQLTPHRCRGAVRGRAARSDVPSAGRPPQGLPPARPRPLVGADSRARTSTAAYDKMLCRLGPAAGVPAAAALALPGLHTRPTTTACRRVMEDSVPRLAAGSRCARRHALRRPRRRPPAPRTEPHEGAPDGHRGQDPDGRRGGRAGPRRQRPHDRLRDPGHPQPRPVRRAGGRAADQRTSSSATSRARASRPTASRACRASPASRSRRPAPARSTR